MPFVERSRYSLSTLNLCKGPSFGGQGPCCTFGPSPDIGGIKDRQGRRIVGWISFTRPKQLSKFESNVYAFRPALTPPSHGITRVQEIRPRFKTGSVIRFPMSRPRHRRIFFSELVSIETEMDYTAFDVLHVRQDNGGHSEKRTAIG
jgi:hypothetical protein